MLLFRKDSFDQWKNRVEAVFFAQTDEDIDIFKNIYDFEEAYKLGMSVKLTVYQLKGLLS